MFPPFFAKESPFGETLETLKKVPDKVKKNVLEARSTEKTLETFKALETLETLEIFFKCSKVCGMLDNARNSRKH